MKKNFLFKMLLVGNIVLWISVGFSYFFVYQNFEIKTELPENQDKILEYIKTLKTYPELNNKDYFLSGTNINPTILEPIISVLESSGATYETCDKQKTEDLRKLCKNIFVANSLDKLVNNKGLVKKEVCEEIEKRFGKNMQRNRCYMHYGTVMGDMTKNISFCKYLPTEKELGINKFNISNEKDFFNFSKELTRENCEFIVYYATIGSDEYNGTYLDKVRKSNNQYDSVLYQKTLNKYGDYHYVTRNKDKKPYGFIMDGNGEEFDNKNYKILRSIYLELKSKFLIK